MAQIGLQLYTVKDEAERDLPGTLRAVGQMGYAGVEFAGIPREPASEIKDVLDESGLAVAGIVVPLQKLYSSETRAAAFAYSTAIGNPTILFPWLDNMYRSDANAYRLTAHMLNMYGRNCRDNGLRFLYHIHGYEFEDFGEKTGLDILMTETDPENVGLELDTYWVEHGGGNALALYREYADRCYSIHFKDMNNRQEKRDVEVGDGMIDTAGILRAARGQFADWYIVEQEQFDRPPMESAAISYANLKRLVEETAHA